ncbi:peptidoglycan D,D-transpeptidase FtsI family protein [Crenalkalicoccus roseus]|uniref:peptidoglycan D,D-transpeptidase FtsI family protein n=1 Tax=Crenalkalicoccus roseus TaxID=1485588 RepID=UPI00107FED41|nr:penicillin-binding protein 2 [Crenalkalicoccus roseus]
MTPGGAPEELRPPPAPDAPPAGRTVVPAAGGARGLVRVAAPELARRAQIERTRGRLVLAAGGFSVLFAAVGVKLTLATLVDPAQPRLRAAPTVPAGEPPVARAPITDRNGEVLAVSLRVMELYANPQEISDPVAAADRLLTVLPNLDRERLIERLTKRNVPGTDRPVEFAYIVRNLTPRQMLAVNNLGQPGFHFRPAERRFFPQGASAAHIIGQVDVDGNGIAGVEKAFDERLRTDRAPLRLSIDIRVQVALREAVQAAIADFNGIGGAGVIMDVHTAEVLAMVSLPDYDPSDPMSLVRRPQQPARRGGTDTDPTFNRATVGVYEPGSTFKLFTTAMALDYGTVNLWGGYDASRPIRYGRFTISDFRGKNRWLAVPEIVAYSSNIASAHMAVAVGPQRHREFMARMGMLQRLQVELPETARPLAPSAQGWRDINTMTIGFGHGISVTPLHVVNGVAALANGGILRQPTLVAQPPGAEREGVRVISERTSETMRRLMRLVVTEGSGRSAEVPGYFVGGKTGTAQKVGPRGGYLQDKRIAAFVGAFPMNAPRYAFYIMVDEPKPNARSHGYATAGWVAAPAAGAVIRRVAPILGLVPETERVPLIQQVLAIPLQPPRPPRQPAAPPAAQPRAASAPPPARPPAGAARAEPPPGQMPLPQRAVEPPALRRTEAPAGLRLATAPAEGAAHAPR